ncbi:MAG TPA: hypothetical protein VHS76_16695 [Steroidobacteraceae bacterium]|nr:hypothetical protein [Steroidobacteraceae bacterium]
MVDFCGLGKVRLDADAPAADETDTNEPGAEYRFLEALSEKARARWLAALLDSGNLRARVAGLFLEGKFADFKSQHVTAQEARDELVQLAVGANDPAIYSMAVYMCQSRAEGSGSGACRQISWQAWARADPDNVFPWLALAGMARTNNDPAAESDAFNHAAQAHRSDTYMDSQLALAQSLFPADVSALERSVIATQVIGIEAALPMPPYHPLLKHCAIAAMQDAGVKEQCETLAEILTAHSGSILDFAMGLAIGKRAGWPAAQIDAMEQEKDAMMESIMRVTPPGDADPWSCAGVARLNDYVSLRNQLGEIGAARVLGERSGASVPELARRYAEDMEKILHGAQQQAQAQAQESQP